MQHRAEIDGLRAISVLPVILFHAGFQAFHGGFIGVDVFFVISGYLITSLIAQEREQGRFSIANFYERRARRILPALSFVLLVCLLASWWRMNSSDFLNFSRALAAVAVFSSGLLYIATAGYFDPSSELNPLLHTWSLGVEEQYYLVFPLIFMVLARVGRPALQLGLLLLTVVSLAFAQWGIHTIPTTTFYFMPTRAWELLIGALLALNQARLAQVPARMSQVLSLLGMGMLLAATLYDEATPFPSVYALLPTLGAALVIGFGHANTWVGRFLSTRVLVTIGLISYSAYLWHQPLFAFTRLAHIGEAPSPATMFVMAVLSLVLAYATWRWVETPMRSRKFMSRAQVFALSGAVTVFFVGVGAAGHYHVLSTRWEQQNPSLVNYSPPAKQPARSACRDLLKGVLGFGDCLQIGEGSKTMIVWGDSHAKALQNGQPDLPDTRILVITHSGCPPVPGLRRFDDSDSAHACKEFDVLHSFARLIDKLRPETVVLASRWNNYLRGCVYEGRSLDKQHFLMSDGNDGQALSSLTYREEIFRRQLQANIDHLATFTRVVVLTQAMDLANHTFRAIEAGDQAFSREEVESWHAPEHAVFSQLKLPPNARIVDVKKLFCNEQACATRLGGTLLYRDDNHLSVTGVNMVWKALGEAAAGAGTRSAQAAVPLRQ